MLCYVATKENMQETWVWSQGQEEPLEEKMAICSSILVENPMDRGAWWATARGVAEPWTRLSKDEHR